MCDELVFEFDSFGPWIYEIDKTHTTPRIFNGYSETINSALLSFKIPVKIDRRFAKIGMHLYEMVVSLFENEIVLFTRHGEKVSKKRIYHDCIIAISKTECFLDGTVEIFTNNESVVFEFNTISAPIINKFLTLIRMAQNKSNNRYKFAKVDENNISLDMLYNCLISRLRETEPGFELIAFQPATRIKVKSSIISCIKKVFSKELTNDDFILSSSIAFVSDGYEIIIIDRSTHITDKGDSDYSYNYMYLPIESIQRVFSEFSSEGPLVNHLIFELANMELKYIIDGHNSGIDILLASL